MSRAERSEERLTTEEKKYVENRERVKSERKSRGRDGENTAERRDIIRKIKKNRGKKGKTSRCEGIYKENQE